MEFSSTNNNPHSVNSNFILYRVSFSLSIVNQLINFGIIFAFVITFFRFFLTSRANVKFTCVNFGHSTEKKFITDPIKKFYLGTFPSTSKSAKKEVLEEAEEDEIKAINYSLNNEIFLQNYTWQEKQLRKAESSPFMKKSHEEKKKYQDPAEYMGIPKSTSSPTPSMFTIDNILSSKPKLFNSGANFANNFSPFYPDRSATFSPVTASISSSPFQFRHHSSAVNLNQLASVAAATFNPTTTDFLSE